MAKQLNVNLAFTADTSRAKQQMQDLQNSLNNLMKTNISSDSNLGFSKQIVEAKGAVADLKIALDSAKSSTGGLDLSKFNESLIKSGRTLESYRKDLVKLGPEGESTFLKLAQSIVSAEAPLKRSSRLLTEFSTTLKNTVRWQISSSILHGFMGSVQSAVGYAQDLNESLNNIRIVTGNNAEQMAKFANEANKAAKALSTTTTAYTDAALIYYQQGLDDTQVKERTDITIKMANVSRQSAEEVSDQMTAVWNNFAKGSESLEHFADVMTRLGADTASSSDEIAQGLEKFASIADMIGLSFDNAAAALATVTATTRQSADVVGTAFKTIFARIQGLSLGETLDDGTNLNKYSKALNAVGINIKEQNGELKDMDSILAEMGAKWNTLSKDQQVALAQTVAGVRQYNQLIALMDNFDFYQKNLSAAQNSTGTLQEQADIYAESWEAARDRVKAASQAIYSDLLDDKFFITILNGLEKILTGIDNLIDGIGGLRTVLPLVITLMTKLYGQGMADSIDRITFNIFKNTKQFQDSIKQMREDAKEEASKLYANTGTEAGDRKLENIKQQINLQNDLNDLAKDLNDTQLKELQSRLDIIKTYDDQAVKMAEIKDKASDDLSDSREKLVQKALRSNNSADSSKIIRNNLLGIQKMEEASQKAQIKLEQLNNEFGKNDNIKKFKSGIREIRQSLIDAGFKESSQAVKSLDVALGKTKLDNFKAQVEELIHGNELADSSFLDIDNRVTELSQKYEWTQKETDLFRQKVQELTNANQGLDDAIKGAAEAVDDYKKKIEAAKNAMQQLGTFGNTMISVFQGVSSITAGISSLVNIIETLNNEDATALEKFRTVIMGLSMGLPMVISGGKQLIEVNQKWKTSMDAVNVGETTNIALLATHTIAQKAQTIATNAQDKSLKKLIATTISWMAVNAPVLLLLLAIAAAVGALVGVIKLVSLAWDKWKASTPEGQLETLKEKAEESAEAFNRVQEAVNQTKQAIESLKSTYDTIDGLTQGTNEWRDAILDANAQVLKLLEAYPDLSEFIYNDKGLLRINDAGYEMIDNTNRSRMQAAYNQQINDQQKVAQKEIDNSYIKDFKDQNNKTLSSSYAKALQQIYDQIGESLFTEAYSEEILADLNNAGFANQYNKEDFYNIIKANENVLKENSNRSKKINNLENSKLEMAASQIGSNRSANEIRDLMGETTYSSIKSQKKQDIASSFDKNGWNSYIDYKEGSDQWQSIQDFLSVKGGENAKYVGQKGGKLAIEIDGEEYKYSASEFYDTLAELYTSQEYQQQFENKIRDSLSGTFGNAINNLDIEDVTTIDNFKKNLIDNLTDLGTDEETSNKIFESLASLYKDNENPLQGIQDFTSSTQYIDTTSEAFLNLANALAQTNDQTEKLSIKEQIEELNAQGQIDSMSEYFSSEAESMGLDKDAGKEMQDYAKNLLEVADESELLEDSLSSDADAAAEVAKSVTRMNKGIDTLADNFEDWNSILKKSDKSSAEYSKAMSGMKDALSDVLDVESDIIDNDFIEEHLEEIEKAATGDAEAIDALKEALAADILLEVVGVSKFDDVNQDIQNLHNTITTMDNEIKVGATLEDGDFLEAANNLVSTAGMTVDEAQAYFNSLGYEPEFVTEEQTVKRSIPQETTHTDYSIVPGTIDIMGAKVPIPTIDRITTTRITGYEDLDEVVQVPAMSADGTPQIKKLTKTSSGAMNNYSSSNKGGKAPGSSSKGGGGGSKGKKPTPVKKSDVVDRYKEITDSLELVTDAFDDAGKAADRLYGANKLNAMKKQNDLVLKEIELLKEKKKWALEYLKEDTKILEEAAKKAGVGILFNEDGNIANYTQIMTVLFNELKAATEAAGAEIDEAEQEAIDAIQAKIDNLKEAITQYDDTNATYREIENTIEDRFDDWQQRNYDMINYEMEVKNDLLDREQKIIDTQIKILGDSFYKMAEVAQEYLNKRPIFEQSGDNAKDMYDKATQQYNDNMINDDQYIELLKTSQDALMDNIDSLLDLDETMKNYYSETLSAAQDELSKYTDQLEHLTSVLDHYRSLLDLVGRNKDHETIGKILETSLKNSKNLYTIAKENYDDLAARTERMRKKLEDESLGEKEREQLYDEYMNLVALTAEAEETMYSHLEDIGNKAAEIFSNTMDKIRTEFEATLSDSWKSFNELNTQIDHLTTSQSEYLTKTNQLYETNKLIRQATLDMNDIENAQSKQKYKDYIKYIENLQKSEKLSQAELQIAQAKYELLQAQINLEDAQNAKDNVRMVKDNEGNWGYVYTADQDKISEAQQQYEDAQNNLYNISLQGIQDYQSKISQAMQKAYDEQQSITEAYKRGEIASWEEYQQKLQESRTYWFDYMKDLYNEYGIYEQTMLEYSAEGYQDYTTVNIGSIESFQEAYTNSMSSQMEAANEWKENTDIISEEIGQDYDETSQKIDEVEQASDSLTEYTLEEVIPAIQKECDAVEELSNEWASHRDEVYDTIESYRELIAEMQRAMAMAAMASLASSSSPVETPQNTPTSSGENNKGGGKSSTASNVQEIINGVHTGTIKQTTAGWKPSAKAAGYSDQEISLALKALNDSKSGGGYSYDYDKALQIAATFASGGYTGEWGPEAKWALLHEKEQILTAEQTEKFFNLANRILDFSNLIDQNANSQSIGLSSLLTKTLINNNEQQLRQEVKIEASFPNATDKNEILDAFDNLINLASQYANRKI